MTQNTCFLLRRLAWTNYTRLMMSILRGNIWSPPTFSTSFCSFPLNFNVVFGRLLLVARGPKRSFSRLGLMFSGGKATVGSWVSHGRLKANGTLHISTHVILIAMTILKTITPTARLPVCCTRVIYLQIWPWTSSEHIDLIMFAFLIVESLSFGNLFD